MSDPVKPEHLKGPPIELSPLPSANQLSEKWHIAVGDSIEAQVIWINEMKFFWSNVLVGF